MLLWIPSQWDERKPVVFTLLSLPVKWTATLSKSQLPTKSWPKTACKFASALNFKQLKHHWNNINCKLLFMSANCLLVLRFVRCCCFNFWVQYLDFLFVQMYPFESIKKVYTYKPHAKWRILLLKGFKQVLASFLKNLCDST